VYWLFSKNVFIEKEEGKESCQGACLHAAMGGTRLAVAMVSPSGLTRSMSESSLQAENSPNPQVDLSGLKMKEVTENFHFMHSRVSRVTVSVPANGALPFQLPSQVFTICALGKEVWHYVVAKRFCTLALVKKEIGDS
jgi:hypothetical protein